MLNDCECTNDTNTFADIRPKCDMSGTLEIFKEFNEVYKERLKDTECAGGDAIALKLKTLEDWVADLTEQNTVLVETIEGLEKEAMYQLRIGMNSQRTGAADEEMTDCKACKLRRAGAVAHSSHDIHPKQQCDRDIQLQNTQEKLQKSEKEIEDLRNLLSENESKLTKINEDIVASEKSAREMRAALTAEVAEKHDQVLALRRDVQHLEDKLRQADMQTHFKDDIIKELRKEIKIANNKLQFMGLSKMSSFNTSSNYPCPVSKQSPDEIPILEVVPNPQYVFCNNTEINKAVARGTSPHCFAKAKQRPILDKHSVHFDSQFEKEKNDYCIKKQAFSSKDMLKTFTLTKNKKLNKKTECNVSERCNIIETCGDHVECDTNKYNE